MNAALSAAEKRQLTKLETAIEANFRLGTQHYRKAAAELAQVKALCLYRAYGSFEQYCRERWGFGESRAYQLLTFERVSTIVEDDRLCEAHARVLDPHPPEVQKAAWAAATDGGAKPTAAKLEELLRADAASQRDAIDREEQELRDSAPREERKTRSSRDVVEAIGRHLGSVAKLIRHLPDIADQAEFELDQLRRTVESTTES